MREYAWNMGYLPRSLNKTSNDNRKTRLIRLGSAFLKSVNWIPANLFSYYPKRIQYPFFKLNLLNGIKGFQWNIDSSSWSINAEFLLFYWKSDCLSSLFSLACVYNPFLDQVQIYHNNQFHSNGTSNGQRMNKFSFPCGRSN